MYPLTTLVRFWQAHIKTTLATTNLKQNIKTWSKIDFLPNGSSVFSYRRSACGWCGDVVGVPGGGGGCGCCVYHNPGTS